jgi:hypothetical protein
MNRSTTLVACLCALLYCGQVFGASWDTVLFRDDFDSPLEGMPDADDWVVNDPNSWWRTQGRTFFPSPIYHPNGPFPTVKNGACVIEHHLHNPYDSADPPWTFLGGEIHTIMEFDPSRSYRFEARVRSYPYPSGLVTSFFPYGYDGATNDEIDFEFVSKKVNDDVTYPDGDPVLTNTYNESNQSPAYIAPPDLVLTDWNRFRIYWYPEPTLYRVEWTWLDPVHGEICLRTQAEAFHVPDEPMRVYLNFWAPCHSLLELECESWDDAANPNLLPATDPNQNEISSYEIDYVEVRVGEPEDGDGDGIANTCNNCPNSCDNCPFVGNQSQADADSNGLGDPCQCGDVSGDGHNNFIDARLILLGQVPGEGQGKCDVNGDGACNFVDARLILLGQVSPRHEDQLCPAYHGS